MTLSPVTPIADYHCHIIPGLDDGATSIPEAVEMARSFQNMGCSLIVATPHVMFGVYDNSAVVIKEKLEQLTLAVRSQGLGLRILPGAEVYLDSEIPARLQEGYLQTMASLEYLLIELPQEELPAYVDDVLFRVMLSGVTPVLAHPERNRFLRHNPDKLEEYVSRGMIAQVNAGSLCGFYGNRVKAAAEKMVQRGLYSLIGSDAHCPDECGMLQEGWHRFTRLNRGQPPSPPQPLRALGQT